MKLTPADHHAEALNLIEIAQFEAPDGQMEAIVALAGLHLIAARILAKIEEMVDE